jgi:hypothetical protein
MEGGGALGAGGEGHRGLPARRRRRRPAGGRGGGELARFPTMAAELQVRARWLHSFPHRFYFPVLEDTEYVSRSVV